MGGSELGAADTPHGSSLLPRTQWLIVGVWRSALPARVAAIAILDSLAGSGQRRGAAATGRRDVPGRPPRNGRGLNFAPVRLLGFRTEHRSEGKIANDDDATTPVFSPYFGRVIKLFAKAGIT